MQTFDGHSFMIFTVSLKENYNLQYKVYNVKLLTDDTQTMAIGYRIDSSDLKNYMVTL